MTFLRYFHKRPIICLLLSKIPVLTVYAPTEKKENNITDEFYDYSKVCDTISKNDLTIILGDFNSKIGLERYKNVAGRHTLHQAK